MRRQQIELEKERKTAASEREQAAVERRELEHERWELKREREQGYADGLAQGREKIQKERVKSALPEDESSIGAFYQRFAHATLDTPETREHLFEYFIDQTYVTGSQIVTVTRFYDSVTEFSFEDVTEALENRHEKGELRTYSRSGFDSSPNGGSRGTRTPDPLGVNEML